MMVWLARVKNCCTSDSVDGTVGDRDHGDSSADTVLVENQVQGEVLNKEGAVEGQRLPEKGV
jgi:hypothetical protein